MSESANHEGGLPVAVVSLLALLAVAAMLVSGWRFVSLYSQLGAARQAQSEADAERLQSRRWSGRRCTRPARKARGRRPGSSA